MRQDFKLSSQSAEQGGYLTIKAENVDLSGFVFKDFLGNDRRFFENEGAWYCFIPVKPDVDAGYYPLKISSDDFEFRTTVTVLDKKFKKQYLVVEQATLDATLEDAAVREAFADFFEEKQYFAKIFSKNQENNFPLANKYPEYYLDLFPKKDLIISVKKYTPVSRYEIGTNIAENSVKVYKNGILDSNAKYDKESGIISLSSTVSSFYCYQNKMSIFHEKCFPAANAFL